MILYKVETPIDNEYFEYIEEKNGDIIEVTLKIKLDTKYKSVQNYIDRCKGKQCLASKTIKNINQGIKLQNKD